jgi:predicted TIM-barrel fold metal-dependent hydrolase
VPVADSGPCLDLEQTLAELQWVAANGFGGVFLPGSVYEPELPPHHDTYFDPFWAACEEAGLVLVLHAAFGAQQGTVLGMMRNKQSMMARLIEKDPEFAKLDLTSLTAGELLELGGGAPEGTDMMRGLAPTRQAARKAMAHMILGGVFDRFPALRVMLIELRGDWVPATVAHLDSRASSAKLPLQLRPSEYFRRNWWVAPSSPRPTEVELRHEIGIDRWLFATDYPHPEGTWPDTAAWLRATFAGLPEKELRLMLGENALNCLRLDAAPFQRAAARIGPSPLEIIDPTDPPDADLLARFHKRSGYSSPAEQVDRGSIDGWLSDLMVVS